jgi:transposase
MERKAYTREFKEQAVKLSYASTKRVSETAHELGLPVNMLHRWRREQRGNGKVFPGKGNVRDEEMADLKKRLRQTEQERDILKKAVGFFAQIPK